MPPRLTRREALQAGLVVAALGGAAAELEWAHTGKAAAPRVPFGAATVRSPFPDDDGHFAHERRLGVTLPTMSWFQDWDTGWLGPQARVARDTGHDILLAWQPKLGQVPVSFADILAGKWNSYIDRFFGDLAASRVDVTLRPMHEMNGDFFSWSVGGPHAAVRSVDEWIAVWRWIVARQRAAGGSVRWSWCVNYADGADLPAEAYWPGEDVVDVLGIDVYNGNSGGPWQTPEQLTVPMLTRVRALAPHAPVWLCEVGCIEPRPVDHGQSKAVWLTQLGSLMTRQRLATTAFFNVEQWRLDTSAASFAAARSLVRSVTA